MSKWRFQPEADAHAVRSGASFIESFVVDNV